METNEILKALRQQRNLTQQELALMLEINLSSYQKYERQSNPIKPSIESLIKIADFYGVTVDYLLGRKSQKETDVLTRLAQEFNLTELEKVIVQAYIAISPKEREKFVKAIEKIANQQTSEPSIVQSEQTQQQIPEQSTVQPMLQKTPQPVQRPAVQNYPQQAPVQPQQVERPWIMAARSADGKFIRQVMTQEEVDKLLESLEDAPESGY